ncbi:Inner membrane protein YbjJ [Carnimonas sp. R-84981]|uniref:MFS transporter n=1 Tax=Carnimonas bestiolae TaxID=3402172 RepID=UPI003EDB6EE9
MSDTHSSSYDAVTDHSDAPQEPQQSTSSPYRRASIAFFFALSGLAMSNWAVRLPDIRRTLAINDAQIGLLLLCPVVGSLGLTLLSSYLIGAFGSRRTTRIGAYLIVLSLVLIGWSPNPYTLGGALLVFGAGMGLMNISMNDQASSLERRYRRSIMSSFHGIFSLGGMIGSLSGGALASIGLIPAYHLTIIAALLFVGILVSKRLLIKPQPRQQSAKGPLFVIPKGRLWLVGGIAAATVFVEGSMADWSSLFLTEAGSSTGFAALGLAVFTGSMAVGRLLGDKWIDAAGPRLALQVGGALGIIGLAIAVIFATPITSLVGFVLAGLGMASLFPCLIGLAGKTPDMEPSQAISSVAMMGYVSMMGGPPMLGFLSHAVGLRLAFVALLLSSIVIVALASPAARSNAPK